MSELFEWIQRVGRAPVDIPLVADILIFIPCLGALVGGAVVLVRAWRER